MYDMANLKKLKSLKEAAPEAMAAYQAFDAAALKDGAIPAKYKHLMAIAIAMTTQCPYCIEVHTKKAKQLGCTDAEIAEAVMVAAALRAGAAVTHGSHAIS
jgi:AhpD family alkylhydroperoxidase